MEPSSLSPSADLSPAERQRRSEEAGRALVAAWQASGLSMRAYAQQAGVRAQRLSYWRLRLRQREEVQSDTSGFVEVPRLAKRSVAGVTLELPRGIRLRVEPGCDAGWLRSVVVALVDGR